MGATSTIGMTPTLTAVVPSDVFESPDPPDDPQAAAVNEMIDLIASQRAYETNQRVITAADEMLRKTTER